MGLELVGQEGTGRDLEKNGNPAWGQPRSPPPPPPRLGRSAPRSLLDPSHWHFFIARIFFSPHPRIRVLILERARERQIHGYERNIDGLPPTHPDWG